MESQVLTSVTVNNPEFSDYVANLQLHMTLQARNLVPTLQQTDEDSRQKLLHQTQADFEKFASRQVL
ncbi:hypothetical protein H6F32_03090 [Anabaena sp. FACHB-1237]|uniref:hypothetical protein n=1 Tax=Anabaena sp. FACHB-1237 TaxID=2692769 RepID=UPI001680C579|nr:hypothetical protein [Anabaena sp. FACHB-1237]MBD2136594.1 hypothetical protein [Anabaena sp. FACHB-1237]